LKSWTAAELAKLPKYYVMELDKGMAETVATEAPSASEMPPAKWLSDDELRVFSDEFIEPAFRGDCSGTGV
jgi:hypothetical protein